MKDLTADEKEMLMISLNIRCNMIETGNPMVGAEDVEGMGDNAPDGTRIKALSTGQMKGLIAMKDLYKDIANNRLCRR